MTVEQLMSVLSKLPPDTIVKKQFYTCGKTHEEELRKHDIQYVKEKSSLIFDASEN